MRKILMLTLVLGLFAGKARAQVGNNGDFQQVDENGNITNSAQRRQQADSLGTNKEIPKGIKVWTIDSRFGDRTPAELDTVPHMYMNTIYTTGLRGEYNTTGNLGAPRINRIFADRPEAAQFLFVQPYDFFITPVDKFHFTNTLSPFTNISFNTAGNRTNGEDHLTAKFGVNAGKKLGVGFNFDYLYGRGYYSQQSASHMNYTLYGSYLGDRYQAHLLAAINHQKVTENGGITNDNYITHPESFNESFQTSEIPTVLSRNWNRNDNQHVFFSQRYNVGFNRKVKMTEDEIKARKFAIEAQKDQQKRDARKEAERKARANGEEVDEEELDNRNTFSGRPEDSKVVGNEPADTTRRQTERIIVDSKATADSLMAKERQAQEDTMWMKNEYVPVTSFIHTIEFNNYRRIYQAYETPENYYANTFDVIEKYSGDSIYDKTRHYNLKNTVALSLLEGFNKWAKAGVKVFASHEMRHYTLPGLDGTASWNEHAVSVGGQLSKTQGRLLHYNAVGEFGVAGEDAGNLKIDADIDLNFPLFGDTVTLAANGFFHRLKPGFYYRHYQSRHFMWDNDLDNTTHTRIQGILNFRKTRTMLRVAVDELTKYTYLSQSYTIDSEFNRLNNVVNVKQSDDAISILTAQLCQDFTLGPLNWESVVTYQKSSKEEVVSVPALNIYTNLYLRFKIARVLKCDFGADLRYFTKYEAPDYSPALGQFTTQAGEQRVKTGNYPLVNVYANFHLKHTRFFVAFSHVNAGSGNKNYFLTPHYPLNERILRFGLSWNFFD
ncbi:putative porin [Prevotella sp. kh1p2]|uniref:putative porin n=1 Tax=Prevotella sp. kh1p2 TaxID=1761883 RepID=UPI000B876113|nr:putative porin [Prevotella sp. kh1p2]